MSTSFLTEKPVDAIDSDPTATYDSAPLCPAETSLIDMSNSTKDRSLQEEAARRLGIPFWGKCLIGLLVTILPGAALFSTWFIWTKIYEPMQPLIHSPLKKEDFDRFTDRMISDNKDLKKELLDEIKEVKTSVGDLSNRYHSLLESMIRGPLSRALREIRGGKFIEGAISIQMASGIMEGVKAESVDAPPSFFEGAIKDLQKFGRSDSQPRVKDELHHFRIVLAEYRSKLEATPPPPVKIEVITKTQDWVALAARQPVPDGTAMDGSKLPPKVDIFNFGEPHTLKRNIRFTNSRLVGGAQLLDGVRWENVIFEGMHIRYNGGEVELLNVKFVNCTFEVNSTPRGREVVEFVALKSPHLKIG